MYYVNTLTKSYVKDDVLDKSTIANIAENCSLVIYLLNHPVYDSYVVNLNDIAVSYFIQPYELENIVEDIYHTMMTIDKNKHFFLNIGKNHLSIPIKNILSLEFIDTSKITELAGNYRNID